MAKTSMKIKQNRPQKYSTREYNRCKICGTSRAIGRTDFEIFPERADAERFRRDDLELIRTHERIDMQETYVAATGETRIVQTLKALVPMEGREPLLIGISWDITNFQNIEFKRDKSRHQSVFTTFRHN